MMAAKRMFASSVVESDDFLDLPATSQLLYFHLGMRADNDGVVDCVKQILRILNATDGDMRALIEAGYVISIPNNRIIVITDWFTNNQLRFETRRNTHGDYYHIVKEIECYRKRNNMITAPGALHEHSWSAHDRTEQYSIEQQQQENVEQLFDNTDKKLNDDDVVSLLSKCRVNPKDYAKFCDKYGEDAVKAQLALLQAQQNTIRNPAGWLRRALEQNYEAPTEKPAEAAAGGKRLI